VKLRELLLRAFVNANFLGEALKFVVVCKLWLTARGNIVDEGALKHQLDAVGLIFSRTMRKARQMAKKQKPEARGRIGVLAEGSHSISQLDGREPCFRPASHFYCRG